MSTLPIGNGFYVSESLSLSHQECTNWYIDIPQMPTLSKEVLLGTPGLIELLTSGTILQVNRGGWSKGGVPYFVNGDTLYSITRTFVSDIPTYNLNTLGVIEGTGRVSMANNTTQLMVLNPGGKGYIYNEAAVTPFEEIIDPDFTANGNPLYITFVDGSFVCTTDEDKIIISDLKNGLSWNALLFGTAESDPDSVVAPIVANNQLYITGTVTTEGFQNIGGSGFTYQRNNVFLDKGCVAPFTLITFNQTFFMVGAGKDESPAIWQFNGNNFQKISTTPIDVILANYTDTEIASAFAWRYGTKGHYFLGFVFLDHAFVYDLVTQRWAERKSTIHNEQVRYRVNSIVAAYGLVWVGDSQDGRLGSLDINEYAEYGKDIISVMSTQPFGELEGFTIPMLELTMETGVGNADAPDPKVSLSISRNGKTFSNERARSIGKEGEYSKRIVWRRTSRITKMATLRLKVSAKIKKVLIKLEAK